MSLRKLVFPTAILTVGLGVWIGARAIADEGAKGAEGQPQFQAPPGWSAEDMQACAIAGQPGEQHEFLKKSVGKWNGKGQMWMAPGMPPMPHDCTSEITAVMDGRYTRCEIQGEMPGMGVFHGVGYSGYDNVAQQYVSTWIDNHSTGIMTGVGERSSDGKTMTWTYAYHCPVTKKPTTMRQVETHKGDDAMTLEMFGKDPKSGQEFKMMVLEFTRAGADTTASAN